MSERSVGEIRVESLGGGRYQVDDGHRVRTAFAVSTTSSVWVFLDGRTFVVRERGRTGTSSAARADDEVAVAAPMPATVVTINVEPGQHLARGDVVIMLEAMKMELPIKMPRDGRVITVNCRVGELVQPGVPLLTLE